MDIFSKLIDRKISYIDASDLILEVEHEQVSEETILNILNKVNNDCDCILLGCTHLIKIKELFRKNTNIDILSQDEIFTLFLNEKI